MELHCDYLNIHHTLNLANFKSAEIKSLTNYWLNEYSWRSEEERLNKFPHYITSITPENFDPLNIHFIHQKSGIEGAIPLIFVHGWPGSFLEGTKILKLLKEGEGKVAFDVVVPSLPNYGFSDRVTKKGFSLPQYADVCHKLMLKLGYGQYVAQGGDWGHFVVRNIARNYPQNCKAHHTNFVMAAPPTWTVENPEPEYNEREKQSLNASAIWATGDERGYFAIQSTKVGKPVR
jgi:pimeloyl-ACP methyl ester carboxylesterase